MIHFLLLSITKCEKTGCMFQGCDGYELCRGGGGTEVEDIAESQVKFEYSGDLKEFIAKLDKISGVKDIRIE